MTVEDDFKYPQCVADLDKDVAERFKFWMRLNEPKVMDVLMDNFQLLTWTAVVFFISCLIYYYLLLPSDLKLDLSDVGFNYLTDGYYRSARHKKKNKRELVREVQRLRKIGDLPPIYPNGWFALLESEELKKNQVKHVAALGENFAVFRNDKGEVKILDAYCPHLGANIAIGGKVRGNCVECPFHSWRFDGDTGHCTSVPYSEKTPDFVKIKKWESIEVNDFIFVWYHAENEKPSWYPEENKKIKKWSFQGRSEFLIGCHIQDIAENAADVQHFNSVHNASLLGGPDIRSNNKLHFEFLGTSVPVLNWNQHTDERHIGIANIQGKIKIFNKYSVSTCSPVLIRQIGPSISEIMLDTSLGPLLAIQTVTPIEGLVQKVIHRYYAPYKLTILAKLMLYNFRIQFRRDAMVWNHKTFVEKPILTKEEKTVATFRRWYNQFYTENSPRFNFQKDTLAW